MSKNIRPIPDDFAQRCKVEGIASLARHYHVAKATIYAWIADGGIVRPKIIGGTPKRPVPADFVTVQAGKTTGALRQHYGCGADAIYRWRKETNCPVHPHAPEGFADQFHRMTIDQLRKHYGRGWITIQRWISETGVVRKAKEKRPRTVAAGRPSRAKAARPVSSVAQSQPFVRRSAEVHRISGRRNAYQTAAIDAAPRDMSPAGQAADYLRRFGPVYRCNDQGRPSIGGKFWRRGSAVLTDQELIERANWMRRKEAA